MKLQWFDVIGCVAMAGVFIWMIVRDHMRSNREFHREIERLESLPIPAYVPSPLPAGLGHWKVMPFVEKGSYLPIRRTDGVRVNVGVEMKYAEILDLLRHEDLFIPIASTPASSPEKEKA